MLTYLFYPLSKPSSAPGKSAPLCTLQMYTSFTRCAICFILSNIPFKNHSNMPSPLHILHHRSPVSLPDEIDPRRQPRQISPATIGRRKRTNARSRDIEHLE